MAQNEYVDNDAGRVKLILGSRGRRVGGRVLWAD